MSEDRLTQECFVWFHNTMPNLRGLLFHVPNGMRASSYDAQKMKWMGLTPGVSDFLFMYGGKTYCIELKIATGRQSKSQQKWQNAVEGQGFKYYIIRDLDGFKRLINTIINTN